MIVLGGPRISSAPPESREARSRAHCTASGERPMFLFHLRKPVVERIAGAAHGADRILLAAGVEQFAQAPDMHIHGALVDIDIAAPYAVEQLLTAEHPARMLQEKFQQPVFGRAEIDRATRAHHAALLALELDAAI